MRNVEFDGLAKRDLFDRLILADFWPPLRSSLVAARTTSISRSSICQISDWVDMSHLPFFQGKDEAKAADEMSLGPVSPLVHWCSVRPFLSALGQCSVGSLVLWTVEP